MSELNDMIRFRVIQKRFKENTTKYIIPKLKTPKEMFKANVLPKLKTDIDGKAICNVCGKTLKNSRGVAIHKGKVHKQTNKQPIIRFDIDGNLDYPKKKPKQTTKKPKPLFKDKSGKVEKREFYCYEHKTFHKHMFKDNPSKTYQKCLDSDNFHKFKINMSNYELSNIDFKKKWKRHGKVLAKK